MGYAPVPSRSAASVLSQKLEQEAHGGPRQRLVHVSLLNLQNVTKGKRLNPTAVLTASQRVTWTWQDICCGLVFLGLMEILGQPCSWGRCWCVPSCAVDHRVPVAKGVAETWAVV